MIKGRIAEAIVEQLFLKLGYSVFRYGMENTIPSIMDLLKGIKSEVANDIKRMPDFVIQKNGGEPHFIEVKFRANGRLDMNDFKDYPYENALIILVSKEHIKCISFKELKTGGHISPQDNRYLTDMPEFYFNDNDRKTIINFHDFILDFFETVKGADK